MLCQVTSGSGVPLAMMQIPSRPRVSHVKEKGSLLRLFLRHCLTAMVNKAPMPIPIAIFSLRIFSRSCGPPSHNLGQLWLRRLLVSRAKALGHSMRGHRRRPERPQRFLHISKRGKIMASSKIELAATASRAPTALRANAVPAWEEEEERLQAGDVRRL
jgi:hypothetical protein